MINMLDIRSRYVGARDVKVCKHCVCREKKTV